MQKAHICKVACLLGDVNSILRFEERSWILIVDKRGRLC